MRFAKFWSPTAIRLNQGIPSILTTLTIVISLGSGDAPATPAGPAISVTVTPTAPRRAVRLRRIHYSIRGPRGVEYQTRLLWSSDKKKLAKRCGLVYSLVQGGWPIGALLAASLTAVQLPLTDGDRCPDTVAPPASEGEGSVSAMQCFDMKAAQAHITAEGERVARAIEERLNQAGA